jgi:hypothetical protein
MDAASHKIIFISSWLSFLVNVAGYRKVLVPVLALIIQTNVNGQLISIFGNSVHSVT